MKYYLFSFIIFFGQAVYAQQDSRFLEDLLSRSDDEISALVVKYGFTTHHSRSSNAAVDSVMYEKRSNTQTSWTKKENNSIIIDKVWEYAPVAAKTAGSYPQRILFLNKLVSLVTTDGKQVAMLLKNFGLNGYQKISRVKNDKGYEERYATKAHSLVYRRIKNLHGKGIIHYMILQATKPVFTRGPQTED